MNRRKVLAVSLLSVGFVLILMSSRQSNTAAAQSSTTQPATDAVSRGRYLVAITACNDCHTPFTMTLQGPAPDMTRMLSGHPSQLKLTAAPRVNMPWIMVAAATNTAFAGPWGISFAANLTPHKINGLGAVWDEARFIKAMRSGKHFGEARPILPPMPWQGYSQMTDEDLKAIWAYLQTIPPVDNLVPDAVMPDLKP
jgi:hypothetical protein